MPIEARGEGRMSFDLHKKGPRLLLGVNDRVGAIWSAIGPDQPHYPGKCSSISVVTGCDPD